MSLLTWRLPGHDAAAVEAASLPERELGGRLAEARERLGATGVFHLATCQRVVWLLHGGPEDAGATLRRLYGEWGREVAAPERHDRFAAFAHLSEVASSLDSLVPGEPQVLGQVKAAVRRCDEAGLLGPELPHVLQHVLRTAKEVRSSTPLFQGKVSLLPLAEAAFEEALAADSVVAVLGTGRMGRRAALHLRQMRPGASLHVVSRDAGRARFAAAKCGAEAWTLDRFLEAPPAGLRLVVCAMDAEEAVLDAGRLARWARRGPLTVVDFALPRNAERIDAEGLRVVQMDELEAESRRALASRQEAMEEARRILDAAVARVRADYDLRCHAATLHRLRRRFEEVAEARWGEAPEVGSEEARRWFDQTVRALLHEATSTMKDLALKEA